MIDRMTVSAVARELGLSWDTVNTIAMDATQMIVAADTTRLDGVRVIGVDEHRWSHTRGHGEGFVTVIIDLTPVLEGTGCARLLDMVPGRSAAALTSWLCAQTTQFRDQVEVVAMDGFGGYKTAATEQLPQSHPPARPAADPGTPRPHRRPALRGAPHSADPAAAPE
jgi:transposase